MLRPDTPRKAQRRSSCPGPPQGPWAGFPREAPPAPHGGGAGTAAAPGAAPRLWAPHQGSDPPPAAFPASPPAFVFSCPRARSSSSGRTPSVSPVPARVPSEGAPVAVPWHLPQPAGGTEGQGKLCRGCTPEGPQQRWQQRRRQREPETARPRRPLGRAFSLWAEGAAWLPLVLGGPPAPAADQGSSPRCVKYVSAASSGASRCG